MSTPSIQTLITQAQQVLNLKSSNEIRATLAAVLANANVGTPLNPNLTTQQLWDEFYEIVRQPSDDIMSIITDQMMRMVFSPPAPGGAGADKQVIFNDGGVLAGDAGLVYNKTTDTLTAGNATITGALTVDTTTLVVDSTNDRVGIGTATPGAGYVLDVVGAARITAANGLVIDKAGAGFVDFLNSGNSGANVGTSGTGGLVIYTANGIGGAYGVRYVIDSTGISTWSVAGTTAMTLNSTGLGIGTTILGGQKLAIGSSSDTSATTNGFNIVTSRATIATTCNGATDAAGTTINYSWANGGQGPLIFRNAAISNVLTLDAAGNCGIGVTPSAWGAGYKGVQLGTGLSLMGSTINGTIAANAYFDGTNWKYITANPSAQYYCSYFANGSHVWTTSTGVPSIGGNITFTQAMSLDASGNLLVGLASGALVSSASRLRITTGSGPTIDAQSTVTGNAVVEEWNSATTGDNVFNNFRTEAAGTTRGSITYNRTGGLVAYNVTSDYRAKDIIGPVSNSGSLIDSLKVYLGRMKGATIARPMLIAHEAQEVAPYSVTGIKDEVDADGKDKYQQMDVSSFVPLLIAEIQSLRTRVQTLEAR